MFLFLIALMLVFGSGCSKLVSYCKAEGNKGKFVGDVVVEWIEQDGADRKMKLTEHFGYIDPKGKSWMVPQEAKIDGASIPRLFWTIFGPPFVGDYRRASVVHDYYCDVKSEPWRAVHRMFYDASVSGGVSWLKAKIMYLAVYTRGPRWELGRNLEKMGITGFEPDALIEYEVLISEDDFDSLAEWIEEENPSLEEIDNLAEKSVVPKFNRSRIP